MDYFDAIDRLTIADALLLTYRNRYAKNEVLDDYEMNRRDAILCEIEDCVSEALRELEGKGHSE